MSAYIVSQATINQVLTFLNATSREPRWPGYAFLPLYSVSDVDGLTALGQALWELNHLAVNTRYAHDPAAQADPALDPFKFRFVECTPIQAYKSARCLHYQCTESGADQTTLYRALTIAVSAIADYLLVRVFAADQYEQADWGAR